MRLCVCIDSSLDVSYLNSHEYDVIWLSLYEQCKNLLESLKNSNSEWFSLDQICPNNYCSGRICFREGYKDSNNHEFIEELESHEKFNIMKYNNFGLLTKMNIHAYVWKYRFPTPREFYQRGFIWTKFDDIDILICSFEKADGFYWKKHWCLQFRELKAEVDRIGGNVVILGLMTLNSRQIGWLKKALKRTGMRKVWINPILGQNTLTFCSSNTEHLRFIDRKTHIEFNVIG